MPDTHYENPRLAELYDLDSPWSSDRDFYLSLAGTERQSILDLGCGTGLLCNAYAERGHEVTGVDPSAAMLSIARQKPRGQSIDWVQSFAQQFKSDKRFDLIVMTGHAFQVLLDDRDVQATLRVMRRHASPGAVIVFESRNPEIDWSSQWNYDIMLQLHESMVHESRRFLTMVNDRMTFELVYKFPDQTLISKSELRFLSRAEIEGHILACGLSAEKVLGDWHGGPFDAATSHEMIFFARNT